MGIVSSKILQIRYKQMSENKYLELPLCPSCLERLDPNISSVWSHRCAKHRFDAESSNDQIPTVCECTDRWQCIECPVCTKISFQIKNKQKKVRSKHECCTKLDDLWICLICGHFGCGRFKQSHALQHYKESSHSFCVKLTSLSIWDYKNDEWQHRLFQKRTFSSFDQQNQQTMDEYSRLTVMAKLDNFHCFFNKMLFDIIQQHTANYDEWQKNKIKENEIECKQKQSIINELKQQNAQIDNDRETAEIWLKIKEFQTKNDVK